MTDRIADTSRRTGALVAVIAYIVMFLAAIFSEFYVRSSLVAPGDAAATASNILASESLFRAGILGYLLIIVSDVFMAWGLYVFLKRVNESLSLLTAWFRVAYAAVFAAVLLNLVMALRLLDGMEYLQVFEADQLQAQALLSLNAFSEGWTIGYVFFSLHLFLLGYLVFKLGRIAKIVGVLLMLSSFTYLADNLASLLLPAYGNYAAVSAVLAIPSFLGEFLLVLWLVFAGMKAEEPAEQVVEST